MINQSIKPTLMTPDYTKQTLVWLDLETTGLVPWAHGAQILEIGVIINDKKFQKTFYYSEFMQKRLDSYVFDMHEKSGLLKECANPNLLDIVHAEQELIQFIKENNPSGEKVLLAGNTVHFDKMWLAYFSPAVSTLFDYRVLDVSTFKKTYNLYFNIESPIKKGAHRAIEDILESQQEFEFYMNLIKEGVIK